MKRRPLQDVLHEERSDERLLLKATAYALDYIHEIEARPVIPRSEDVDRLRALDEPMPLEPTPGDELLAELHEYGSPASVAQTGGRYFGFVNGSVIPAALAARWLVDTWDQNAALAVMSPVTAKLEEICERWLKELLGLPTDCVAGFVSGTSAATLCGLAAARHAVLKRMGWDVESDGLIGAPAPRVVTSSQAHATVYKALSLLGLGTACVEQVPVDDEGRLQASRLPRLDDTTIVILQAGNVNTGSFDPLDEVCRHANTRRAWVHVDGAFGLWAAASNETRHLIDGMHLADSWALDGHKTLNTPYDCGIVLTRHPGALRAAMRASGSYIQYGADRDGMAFSPEMSRRARAIELWATLRRLGRTGVAALINGLCARAQQFAQELESAGFRILNNVAFNQVLVACESSAITDATLRHIQQSGECWCGGTQWRGESAIRISVCSWATTPADVSRSVEAFTRARNEALAQADQRTCRS